MAKNDDDIFNAQDIDISERDLVLDDGKAEKVLNVKKRVPNKKWWRIWLYDLMHVLGILNTKQTDILFYILNNVEPSTNHFIGTERQIAAKVGCGQKTVNRVIKKLLAANFMKKKLTGVYRVNPALMIYGNDTKRNMLIEFYRVDDDDYTEKDEKNRRFLAEEVRREQEEKKKVSEQE